MPKSKMWLYFKKVDVSTVSCNLCGKHIKSSGNTSNMMKHLNVHSKSICTDKKDDIYKELKLSTKRKISHWLELDNTDNIEISHIGAGTSYKTEVEEKSLPIHMSTSPTIAAFKRISNYSDSEERHAQISNAILYFICIDFKPFNTIQCMGFKHLMKELAPFYKIPNEDIIKRSLDEKYDSVAQVFKQKLSEALHVTISIDIWSDAISSRSFLGVTVHFIPNGTAKFESGNIEVIELTEYTVNYIVCTLLSTLMKWCIDINKVVAVVTNNEPSIINAVTQIFEKDKHVDCFAHIINLVAENSIKNCDGLDNIINKVRSIMEFVNSSDDISNELYQRQLDLGTSEDKIKKVILDDKIRWNSIFYMAERFVELWNMINEILFTKHEDLKMPTADEFITLKEILDLLKPLEFVAQECSAETYIMISKIIPLISCTLTEYKKTTQTMELSIKLKEVILVELESRFGHIEFISLISIATILDPRFKVIHFQNTQALANVMYLLRDIIRKLQSNAEQEEVKYDLWIHHKHLTHKPKKEDDDISLNDELSLYLASPLTSLKDDPLEKWESMKTLYPSLYKVAMKYLSIVATSVPGERLFSKMGITMTQSRNELARKGLNKLLFLNSMNHEYWFQ